jgi:hypothetical protein
VSGGPACSREAFSQAEEEEQGSEYDRGVELGTVEGVCDEMAELYLRVG